MLCYNSAQEGTVGGKINVVFEEADPESVERGLPALVEAAR